MSNCTYVAEAFDRYLAGEGIKPVPGNIPLQSLDRLESVYGRKFTETGSGTWSITYGIPTTGLEVWWPRDPKQARQAMCSTS